MFKPFWIMGILLGLLGGCASLSISEVPGEFTEEATIAGFESIRFFGDDLPKNARKVVKKKVDQSIASRPDEWNRQRTIDVNFLIITGGGSDGAFGAGLINGMTDGNNRPKFEVVTGVSTGALIAPFAFLGPDYDEDLKAVYTQISTRDIVNQRNGLIALGTSATGDTKPLQRLIAKHVTPEFLTKIAHEYQLGRRLFVGTTNLNAQRAVIWNMGEIASYENAAALSLFRKILLASAAIPVAFPPVTFEVMANGEVYEELHVDGGTTNNAFFLPLSVGLADYLKQLGLKIRPTMYVIRNSKSAPEWKAVDGRLLNIAKRSISTLVKNSTSGDLHRLFSFTTINNIGFNFIDVPESFDVQSNEAFDQAYMVALYNTGYEMGLNGVKWKRKPPGL